MLTSRIARARVLYTLQLQTPWQLESVSTKNAAFSWQLGRISMPCRLGHGLLFVVVILTNLKLGYKSRIGLLQYELQMASARRPYQYHII